MARTARRRWTREIEGIIDGVTFDSTGPVLIHSYDPPVGGKWRDTAIPGKIAALDRSRGETLWRAPCEIGYGRGFGAGLGLERDLIVLGPGLHGHRIVRMTVESGELLDMQEIEAFDEAVVQPDVSLCLTPGRIFAIDSRSLVEVWEHMATGRRFHRLARYENRVHVVYTHEASGLQGVMVLDVESGHEVGTLLAPSQRVIHHVVAASGSVVLVLSSLFAALPPEIAAAVEPSLDDGESLALLAMPADADEGDAPLWFHTLPESSEDELPPVGLASDSGKLYLAEGATLRVHDLLTGRGLGELTIPGLDMQVAWDVADGAVLLAEETQCSIFEVPD